VKWRGVACECAALLDRLSVRFVALFRGCVGGRTLERDGRSVRARMGSSLQLSVVALGCCGQRQSRP
jgi:hypothetical protein